VERGSDQHGPRQDDCLEADRTLGSAGGHRAEQADREPPVDDPPRPDIAAPDDVPTDDVPTDDVATDVEERMTRLRHDLEVANDSRYEDREMPGLPDG
jgi:hypothetical protein